MTAMFLTFVGLIALRIAWGAWKSTCRDVARDRLFDLRDEWREFFVANGLSMELPEYAKVRGMINDYIRYTARFRLFGLLFTALVVPREVCFETAARTDEEFRSSNPRVAMEIARIRHRAVSAIQVYMLRTSILVFPFLAIAFCVAMVAGAGELIGRVRAQAKRLVDDFPPLSPPVIEMAAVA